MSPQAGWTLESPSPTLRPPSGGRPSAGREQEPAMKKVKGLAHRKRGKKTARCNAKRKAKLRRARRRQSSGERATYR